MPGVEKEIVKKRQPYRTPKGEPLVSTKKTVRINVNLPEEVYNNLRAQADQAGIDMSAFVRNALRVYTTLQDERSQNKKIYIGTSERIEKELLLP